jgi:hypothetical protein
MSDDAMLAERYYGTTQAVPIARRLSAGPWSALLVQGALRDIRYDGVEIIRSIAYLVRDRDWGTCVPELRELSVDEQAGAFRVAYEARCENVDGQTLAYRILIECEVHEGLSVHAECTARSEFLTARCGFCVLHPIDGVAGAAARVEHGDGTIEDAHFPEAIDPWQPFMDIRSIEQTLRHGLTVRCELRGDVFEMEDQRNWSDASFKTYSRPLALPWPYMLAAGEMNDQTVRVRVEASQSAAGGRRAANAAGVEIVDDVKDVVVSLSPSLRQPRATMPALGLAVAPREVETVLANLERLAELAPQHLLLHLDPLAGHGLSELRHYALLLRRSGLPATLEYALPGVDAPERELATLAAWVEQAGLPLTGIVVSPSVHRESNPPGSISPPCPPLDEVYREARRAFPGLRLGGGMLSYFTELNRKRPPLELVDVVTHATCPIVHAADDRSVMETLEAVPHITRSCRALIGSRPYVIGPVSIGMRQNPYGSRVMPNPDRQRIAMAEDDPRQHGLFGAAWLAGYAAALADADLECLTLGALTGPRGLIGDDGQRYPVFAIAAVLARLAGTGRIECRSSRGSDVAAFAARSVSGVTTLVLANLTPDEQRCRFDQTGMPGESLRERVAEPLPSDSDPGSDADLGSGESDASTVAMVVEKLRQTRVAIIDEQTLMRSRDGRPEWSSLDVADGALTLRPFACALIEWGEAVE